MSAGAGIDIASVSRLMALLERRPEAAGRLFTPAERAYAAGHAERWASRWAAKEAVRKLYGSTGRPLPDFAAIEVVSGVGGAPWLRVDGVDTDLRLSLSHDGDLAVAVVVGEAPARLAAPVPPLLRLPDRPEDAHKGTFGTVLVVAGAVGMSGAPLMSAMAAARGGAGKVRLCVPEPVYQAVAAQTLEVMAHPLPARGGGFSLEAKDALREEGHLDGVSAVVIGPGIGRAAGTEDFLDALLPGLPAPAVVDADGLNIAAARNFDWRRCPHPVVLTPHPAEMGRLAELATSEVQAGRGEVAAAYARERGVVVVLKGSDTVVAAPDGRMHTSSLKVVALATGGTGDVLSGLLAALVGQGLDPFDAAVAAVFIHAEAGLTLQSRLGRAGVLPRDLLDELPAAQERCRRELERRHTSAG